MKIIKHIHFPKDKNWVYSCPNINQLEIVLLILKNNKYKVETETPGIGLHEITDKNKIYPITIYYEENELHYGSDNWGFGEWGSSMFENFYKVKYY